MTDSIHPNRKLRVQLFRAEANMVVAHPPGGNPGNAGDLQVEIHKKLDELVKAEKVPIDVRLAYEPAYPSDVNTTKPMTTLFVIVTITYWDKKDGSNL